MFSKNDSDLLDTLRKCKNKRGIKNSRELEDLVIQLIEVKSKHEEVQSKGLSNIDAEINYFINLIDISTKSINIINAGRSFILKDIEEKSNDEYVAGILNLLSGLYLCFEYATHFLSKINLSNPTKTTKITSIFKDYSINLDRFNNNDLLNDRFYSAIRDSVVSCPDLQVGGADGATIQLFKPSSESVRNNLRDILKDKGCLTHRLSTYSQSKNITVIRANRENNSYEIYGLFVSVEVVAQIFFVELNLIFNPNKACFEICLDHLFSNCLSTDGQIDFDESPRFSKLLHFFFASINLVYFYDQDQVFYNNFISIQLRTEEANTANDSNLLKSAINPS